MLHTHRHFINQSISEGKIWKSSCLFDEISENDENIEATGQVKTWFMFPKNPHIVATMISFASKFKANKLYMTSGLSIG